MRDTERVVITGLGAVCSLGHTAEQTFAGLLAGRSGLRHMAWPDSAHLSVRVGAPVTGFTPPVPTSANPSTLSRAAQFALTAAREAVAASGLRRAGYDTDRVATITGVALGDSEAIETASLLFATDGGQSIDPALFVRMLPGDVNDVVARDLGYGGPSYCPVSACASAAHAIGEAFEGLRAGEFDAVLTGGAEAVLTPLSLGLFERIGAVSRYDGLPELASRPFDRARDGFVMGEGAGMLVLETLAAARRRGARVYAELLGYGASADAFHIVRPSDDGDGMAQAMLNALRSARLAPEQVQYVNAHGTSTPLNDLAETTALKSAFGAHAARLLVSSNKSMLGHLLGAAAAVETVATALTLLRQQVPPTLNLEHPGDGCDLDYVPGRARAADVRVALKNSFGFGGQNACLLLGRI